MVDVRLIIAEEIAVHRKVRGAFPARRRLDVLHAAASRQIFRRDIGPRLAVVARDVKRPVVRARPDDTDLERRLGDRVQRAVNLFTGHITRDRLAAPALTARGLRRQIRRDLFPRYTLVARAMQILGPVIKDIRIVRRRRHRRDALESINQIDGVVAVQRLCTDPIILFLAGLEIHHAVLALARSVDDVRIARVRHDRTRLTSWTASPVGQGVRLGDTRDNHCRVVLLRAVQLVRKLIVHPHAVNLGGRLVELR